MRNVELVLPWQNLKLKLVLPWQNLKLKLVLPWQNLKLKLVRSDLFALANEPTEKFWRPAQGLFRRLRLISQRIVIQRQNRDGHLIY
jgi:hypothetical protein